MPLLDKSVKNAFLTVSDYFFLLRIPLLVPVWTVLILGWIAGNREAVAGGWIFTDTNTAGQETFLWIAVTGFSFIVASIYVVNQIVDVESDRINHKLFILPNGLVSIRSAWISAIACAVIGLLTSIMFLDLVMVFLFGISLVLGFLYNLPPASLKNRAWGGVIANFLGHGMVTFLIGWYAAQYYNNAASVNFYHGIVSSLTAGFANAAVFLTTTIPDAAGDQSVGKQTFCVMYGEKKTAIAAAVCCSFALLFSFFLQFHSWVMIIPTVISLIIFIHFIFSAQREFAFKTFRWPVYLLSTFVVIFVPLYGMIIIVTLFISRLYYKIRFNYEYPTLKNK